MSTPGVLDNKRKVFIENLVGGTPAHLTLGPGITMSGLRVGIRQGLALQVAQETVQTGQLQRALERRFEQAAAFDGCFVYLDTQNTLVIWHALPATNSALDRVLSRLLTLASLQALDTASTR